MGSELLPPPLLRAPAARLPPPAVVISTSGFARFLLRPGCGIGLLRAPSIYQLSSGSRGALPLRVPASPPARPASRRPSPPSPPSPSALYFHPPGRRPNATARRVPGSGARAGRAGVPLRSPRAARSSPGPRLPLFRPSPALPLPALAPPPGNFLVPFLTTPGNQWSLEERGLRFHLSNSNVSGDSFSGMRLAARGDFTFCFVLTFSAVVAFPARSLPGSLSLSAFPLPLSLCVVSSCLCCLGGGALPPSAFLRSMPWPLTF